MAGRVKDMPVMDVGEIVKLTRALYPIVNGSDIRSGFRYYGASELLLNISTYIDDLVATHNRLLKTIDGPGPVRRIIGDIEEMPMFAEVLDIYDEVIQGNLLMSPEPIRQPDSGLDDGVWEDEDEDEGRDE